MRQRSLRLRLTFAFGFGAALLSVLFATVAYFGVRHTLVTDRQSTDLRQAYVNAELVRNAVLVDSPSLHQLVQSLDLATSSVSIVDFEGVWYASNVTNPRALIPIQLRLNAAQITVSRQVLAANGSPELVIDVPLPGIRATYYQIHSLTDLEATLRSLLLILGLGALFTTSLGAMGGWLITRRAMAPLEMASLAAQRVANGALDTRIPEDPRNSEITTLATSFNTMIEQLVERLERDARFAGDVSHELRSPLTTLATTVEVMRHSRDQLSPDGRAAFDLLAADVGTFQQFVEDLLEITRSDAGANSLHVEAVALDELVRQCVRSAAQRRSLPEVPIVVGPGVPGSMVLVDRRRFERVIANLLENAERYANGAVAVRLSFTSGLVTVDVDDAGPGVDPDERARIFDRFYRGSFAHDRGASRGTGLGLAIVTDHVKHVGGQVRLLDSPEGGARFRIELPVINEVPE